MQNHRMLYKTGTIMELGVLKTEWGEKKGCAHEILRLEGLHLLHNNLVNAASTGDTGNEKTDKARPRDPVERKYHNVSELSKKEAVAEA
jgi:hypothetical protein